MIQRMEETGKDLTYTIQVSTNGSSGWITKGTTYGKSGSSISITASGLSQITSYYWKVIVTDTGGLSVDTGTNSAITTMCSGTGATCSYMRNDCACPSVGKPLTHYPSLHLQIMIAIQVACVICVERMRCIAMLLRQKEQLGTTRHLVHR